MTWRRFYVVVCLIMVAVGVLRLITGNILGGLIALILAALVASFGLDFPILSRLRDGWRFLRKHWLGKE